MYAWQNVVTFGGFQEDFMLVVQPDENAPEKNERHLFAMPPGRVSPLRHQLFKMSY